MLGVESYKSDRDEGEVRNSSSSRVDMPITSEDNGVVGKQCFVWYDVPSYSTRGLNHASGDVTSAPNTTFIIVFVVVVVVVVFFDWETSNCMIRLDSELRSVLLDAHSLSEQAPVAETVGKPIASPYRGVHILGLFRSTPERKLVIFYRLQIVERRASPLHLLLLYYFR
ncbi:hypothetical protein BHM03_00022189 [Ensete ventricosum]|nr:hypothetical protein BHM03_00022189 [Ensete ventricosum]